MYTWTSPPYRIDVIYQFSADWRFVSKRISLTSAADHFRVDGLRVIDATLGESVRDVYVQSSERKNLELGDYGAFLRFATGTGLLVTAQNPFLAVERHDDRFAVSYSPAMEWRREWGAFESDRALLAPYRSSGRIQPAHMVPEWRMKPTDAVPGLDEAEVAAFTDTVRAFLLYRPGKPLNIFVGKLDVPHLEDAIGRIPQNTVEGLTADAKGKLQERARRLLEEAQRAVEKSNTPADDHAASPTVESTTRAAPPRLLTVALEKRIPLLKTGDERYVLGIVLEPEVVDAQDDIYSAAEIREAAHRFMEEYRNIGLMHRGLVNGRVKILESYLAPTPFALEGAQVRKGTWLLAMRVLDDDLWSQVKSGELTGLSMGGSAARLPEPAAGSASART